MPFFFKKKKNIDKKQSSFNSQLNQIFYDDEYWKSRDYDSQFVELSFQISAYIDIERVLPLYFATKGIPINIKKNQAPVITLIANKRDINKLLSLHRSNSPLIKSLNKCFFDSGSWSLVNQGPYLRFNYYSKHPFNTDEIAQFFEHKEAGVYQVQIKSSNKKSNKYCLEVTAHMDTVTQLLQIIPQETNWFYSNKPHFSRSIPVLILDDIIERALSNSQYHRKSQFNSELIVIDMPLNKDELYYKQELELRLEDYLIEMNAYDEEGVGFGVNRRLTLSLPQKLLPQTNKLTF